MLISCRWRTAKICIHSPSPPLPQEAILKLIDRFGEGVFACVMDSYDYVRALQEVLPSIADAKLAKGGVMILRPDSGDSVETVLQALRYGLYFFLHFAIL
jgi:nicotinamide phosphoribosyltransferase